MPRSFKSGATTSFGVEYEATVINRADGSALPIAGDLAADVSSVLRRGSVSDDMFASTFEFATAVCSSIDEARSDFEGLWRVLQPRLDAHGAALLGMGLHPTLAPEDAVISAQPRAAGLLQAYQWTVRQLFTTGLHVHVGMPDGDTAIGVAHAIRPYLPVLTALSASSPFSRGHVTGLASTRSLFWRSFPRSGQLPPASGWADYAEHLDVLADSTAVPNPMDFWWDCRPKPELGTLEIRVCDTVPVLEDALALVSLIWCLGSALASGELTGPAIHPALVEENQLRAMRDGVAAQFIVGADGATLNVAAFAAELVAQLMPVGRSLGCEAELASVNSLSAGNAAHQRLVESYARGGIAAVIDASTVNW